MKNLHYILTKNFMLLNEAINIYKNSKEKIDILETLGINVYNNYLKEKYYQEKIKSLPKGDYFISDLDGTFFRGILVKEAFTLFIKYVKDYDIRKMDKEFFKEFLDDYIYYVGIEKDACNKKVHYYDYTDAGLFMIYKYHNLIDFDNFLEVLKAHFNRKNKVNPFRFSMDILKKTLLSGNNFLFLSGASNFVFKIYLDLLKENISDELGKKYADKIFGISTYADFNNKKVFDVWTTSGKENFIKNLKEIGIIKKVTGGMGDTNSDFGIVYNLEKNSNFYFINPAKSVIIEFEKYKKDNINYHFITEKKDLIFEFNINNIKIK